MKFSHYVKCLLLLVLFVIFWTFSAGCEVNGTGITQTWIDTEIGPDGGEIVGSMGSIIIVPQGALNEWTTITVEEAPYEEIPEHEGFTRISSGLLLKPEGLTFNKPVSIYIPYADYDYSINQQKTRIAMYSTGHVEKTVGSSNNNSEEAEVEWEKLDGTVDVDQKVSRAETSHFSVFAVYYDESEDGDVDQETDESCECENFAGNWILMSSSICGESMRLEISKAKDECILLMTMKDGFGNGLQNFTVNNCEFPVSLKIDDLTDCELSYESEVDNIIVKCSECGQMYTREQK